MYPFFFGGLVKNFARLPLLAILGWMVSASAGTSPGAPAADAARLDQVLAGDQRSEENRARDTYRHPRETLAFFGVQPNMTIVEIFPGDGWYTEVLAPLVRGTGKLYAAHYDPDSTSTYSQNSLKRYREKLASRPDVYDQVTLTILSPEKHEIAPPGSADLVVTFRNMHNWMNAGYAPAAFKAMYDALKPGGVLGIEEHRGRTDQPQDPEAKSGDVDRLAAFGGHALGRWRAVEGRRREAFHHLVRHEAAACAVNVHIARLRLVRDVIFERTDEMQLVLRARHRNVEEPALFLDQLGLARREF